MREVGFCPECGAGLKTKNKETYAYSVARGILYVSLQYDVCPKCGDGGTFKEIESALKKIIDVEGKICRQ